MLAFTEPVLSANSSLFTQGSKWSTSHLLQKFFSTGRGKVYKYIHWPYDQMSSLGAMEATGEDITVESCRFYPQYIARENPRCKMDRNMRPDRRDGQDVQWSFPVNTVKFCMMFIWVQYCDAQFIDILLLLLYCLFLLFITLVHCTVELSSVFQKKCFTCIHVCFFLLMKWAELGYML